MKTYSFLLAASLFFVITHVKAQAPVYKEATLIRPAEMWLPFNFTSDGTNTKEGVQIYIQEEECEKLKVKVVKLVNQNAYPVTLSYQLSPESTVISVKVPALYSIDGSCTSTDENIRKLVISEPEEKLNSNIKYIKSHITIAPVK